MTSRITRQMAMLVPMWMETATNWFLSARENGNEG